MEAAPCALQDEKLTIASGLEVSFPVRARGCESHFVVFFLFLLVCEVMAFKSLQCRLGVMSSKATSQCRTERGVWGSGWCSLVPMVWAFRRCALYFFGTINKTWDILVHG